MGRYANLSDETPQGGRYSGLSGGYTAPKTGFGKFLQTISGQKGESSTGETKIGAFLSGAVQAPMRLGSNLARLLPGDQSKASEEFKKRLAAKVDPFFGVEKETAFPLEKDVGDIASGFVGGGAALKGMNYLSKVPRVSKFLQAVTNKSPRLADYAGSMLKSAGSGAGSDIAYQGEIGTGTGVGTAFGLLGPAARTVKQVAGAFGYTKEGIAKSLQLDTVLSSGTKEKIARTLGKSKDNLDKWFTERGFTGSLKEIKEQALARKDAAQKSLADFYGRVSQNPNSKLQANGVKNIFKSFSENSEMIPSRIQKAVGTIKEAYQKQGKRLSPLQMESLKQYTDEVGGIFKVNGDMIKSAEDLMVSRRSLQNTLENLGKKYGVNVNELNKEIQVGTLMGEDLFKREVRDVLLKGVALPGATLGTLGYVGASAAGSENSQAVGLIGLLIGVTGGLALQNTQVRTNLAKWMQKNVKKEITELGRITKDGKKLPDKLIERIYKKMQTGINDLTQ